MLLTTFINLPKKKYPINVQGKKDTQEAIISEKHSRELESNNYDHDNKGSTFSFNLPLTTLQRPKEKKGRRISS
jgi:hypothetical protein